MIASVLLAATAGVSVGAVLITFRPSLLDRRWLALALPAAVSAIGGVLADGAPTGWRPLDAVARAALGAGIVYFGAGSRSRPVLLSALAAVVAATGDPVQPVAAAAGGLLVVPALSSDDRPFLTAVASGMIAQAVLRLSRPDTVGVTALAAALIVLPIVASGMAAIRPVVRRRLIRVTFLLGALAIVGAGVGLAAALGASENLRQGLRIVDNEVIPPGGGTRPATQRLASAKEEFRAARRTLESWWARPAGAVPVVSQHWRALRSAAVSGEELSDLGLRTSSSFDISGIQITDGQVPLGALTGLQPALRVAATDLGAARRRLTAAQSPWLFHPVGKRLADGRGRVAAAETGARTALRVLPRLPGLLGADGPRTYFLAVQTPAELRATGGFIGNYGEITAANGKLSLTRFGSIVDLYGGDLRSRRLLAPRDYTDRYRRFLPEQEWGNVNLSPHFPTDAQVIGGLYPQSGGTPIDGVVAIDPAGLAAILKAMGPVQVDRWPTAITADNVVPILLREQYARFDQRETDRADFVKELTQKVWGRLTTGSFPIARLLGSLASAIEEKHLLLASYTAPEQALFEELGAAGTMAPADRDFLGVITQNAGANKLDAYLRRQVDYRVNLDPGNGKLRASLRVTLHNDAPRSGLPSYVVGRAVPPVPPGADKLYVSIYTPWQLGSARIDGKVTPVEIAQELGRQVYSTFLVVPPQGRTVVELELTGRLARHSDYRLRLHRQPTVAPDEIRTTVAVPLGWSVRELPGTRISKDWKLQTDATFRVPLRRQW